MEKENNKAKALETLIVLIGALIILFWTSQKKIFLLLALLLVVIAITSGYLSNKVAWLWLQFAELLGKIMSQLLLTIVYFVFLVPIAIFYQISKKDVLNLNRKEDTYYVKRDHQYSSKDIENVW